MSIRRHSIIYAAFMAFLIFSMAFFFASAACNNITIERCKQLKLPILFIETDRAKAVSSKENYVNASYSMGEKSGRCKIRGHGNTTWRVRYKKPYLLKLDTETSLCGLPAAQKWILLANTTTDKTSLRNFYAFHLATGIFDKNIGTPKHAFITLFLNGKYIGLYLLAEKIEFAANRLSEYNDKAGHSFVAEVNSHQNRICNFWTANGTHFSIRSPETDWTHYTEYMFKIEEIEDCIYQEQFVPDSCVWKEYLDIDSFIDWYLVNEFTKNHDAAFQSSCFMVYDADSKKLHMGPVWDFDIACGNIHWDDCDNPEGFWINRAGWYEVFLRNKAFSNALKSRWAEKCQQLKESLEWIRVQSEALMPSIELNDAVWKDIGHRRWPHATGWKGRQTYQSEIDYMIGFLERRLEWMDHEYR